MKIISYNINSLRKRINLLQELITDFEPEIICLQEIKISHQKDFPFEFFENLGFKNLKFRLSLKGQGGVLIASKNIELIDENSFNFMFDQDEKEFFESNSHRHISVKFSWNEMIFRLHNFYVPSGGSGEEENDLLNPKFLDKLKFFKSMVAFFERNKSDGQIIVGDLNIAPFENDVFNHKMLLKVISHTEQETQLFRDLLEKGEFDDLCRIFHQHSEKIFSWWSYRSKDFQKNNRGRRLDHVLTSKNISAYVKNFRILSEYRKKDSPSDHSPVMIEL
jgi:exodeoxyribonuclease-3